MMYAKSESDMISFDLSSPRSPKPFAYYVQSPSRDSHDDGDKSSTAALTQATATPSYDTPSESHLYTPLSRPSSSVSRISGGSGGFRWKDQRGLLPERRHVIHEESGRYEDLYEDNIGISVRKCRVILSIVVVTGVFAVCCLVIWGACRPFSPVVAIESLEVQSFYYGGGLDRTGVPTNILNLKSSLKMTTENPASFFGIYVGSSTFKLIYSEFTLATGQLKSYYQSRKSKHTTEVELVGDNIPLYGAGTYLADSDKKGGVPVRLEFEIRTHGNLVGNLVRSKHRMHLSCSFYISSWNTKLVEFTEKTCKHVTK